MAHRLSWEKPGSSEQVFRHLIVMALNRSAVAALVQDLAGDYIYVANIPSCWPIDRELARPTDRMIFGEALGERLETIKQDVMASGQRLVFEEAISGSASGDRFFEFTIEIIPVAGSSFILTTICELTAERRREQMLRALLREVSHRSKNLLAIILSITTQTAKGSPSLPSFLRHFRGRIFSLSQSQDLVTDKSWRGAYLHELVRAQAGKYLDNERDMLVFEGLNPLLDPNQALHIGLAMHELFIDAISLDKDGATLPRVVVSCREKAYNNAAGLELVWQQINSDQVHKSLDNDEADEFRSTVLYRVAPLAVGGEAELSAEAGGLRYSLRFPAIGIET